MSYFTAVKIGAALAKARVQAGLDPCPDAPQPPIDDLKINYKAGRAAAENGAFGYIGKKKE